MFALQTQQFFKMFVSLFHLITGLQFHKVYHFKIICAVMYSILFILINYYMKSFNEVYNLFIKCNKVFQKMDLVVSLSQEGGQP